MKQIIKFVLMIVITLSLVFSNKIKQIEVDAAASFTEESKTTLDLGYGVTIDTVVGTSKSTFNSSTQADGRYQTIYTANMSKDSPAKIVQWSYTLSKENTWGSYTLETIAEDYEKYHPGKKVLVAMNNWLTNSDFTSTKGELNSVTISDGLNPRVGDKQEGIYADHYHSDKPNFLGFEQDGTVVWSDDYCEDDYTDNLVLSFYNGCDVEKTYLDLEIDKINQAPEDGEIAIFFRNYKGGLTTFEGATIYKMQGELLRFDNCDNYGEEFIERDAFAKGHLISTVGEMDLNYETAGYYVYYIVSKNEKFNALDLKDKTLIAQYELLGKYSKVVGATTFYYHIVRDGVPYDPDKVEWANWNETNCEVHPRSVFIIKEDGTYALSVIDGRNITDKASGMDYEDMGYFYKNYYNAKEAFNYDGGGSSCMVISTSSGWKIINHPSDGRERQVANACLIVVDEGPFTISQTEGYLDKVEINITDINENVDKIYATYNSITKEVVDGKVSFEGLTKNSEYDINFSYTIKGSEEKILTKNIYAKTANTFATVADFKVNKISQDAATVDIEFSNPGDNFNYAIIKVGSYSSYIYDLSKTIEITGLVSSTKYDVTIKVYSSTGLPNDHEELYSDVIETTKALYPDSLKIMADKTTLYQDESVTLNIECFPSGTTSTYTYESKDEVVVEVSSSGLVTAICPGTTTVVVTTAEGKVGEITFTVLEGTNPNIEPSPSDDTTKKGCKKGTNLVISLISISTTIAICLRKKH